MARRNRNPIDPDAVARPFAGGADTAEPDAEPGGDSVPTSWVEKLLERHFLQLPSWARVTVYFLVLFAFLHNYLKPTTLEGTVWLERDNGGSRETLPAEGYVIQSGHYSFKANASGFWILRTGRKLPGTLKAELLSPLGQRLDEVALPMPIPLVSYLFETPCNVFYNTDKRTLTVTAGFPRLDLDFSRTAYAQTSPRPAASPRPGDFRLRIDELWIREAGDSHDESGRIYFRVRIDDAEATVSTLPQEQFPNTHLVVRDNSRIYPHDLTLSVPRPSEGARRKVEILIYEKDRSWLFFRGKDDLVATFELSIDESSLGKTLELESGPVERAWIDNSSLKITIDAEERAVSPWAQVKTKG